MSCHYLLFPWLKVSWEPLEFRERELMYRPKKKRAQVCSKEKVRRVLCFESSYIFSKTRNLRGLPRGGSQQNIHIHLIW